MSTAAKNRKKAIEFEQLKQFDKAIAAYVRAIELSEKELGEVDVALFNKVGDLTLRQGRVSDAVTYYERAVEHYVTAGLYNNAIALCNKILRSAPGRSAVYFTLGRICARKGLRGDATRNFLEYASRMQQEGRVDEGMRALAEVADLMPELTEVRRLVEEHAQRAGITLPQRKVATPSSVAAQGDANALSSASSRAQELVFLEIDYPTVPNLRAVTPPIAPKVSAVAAPQASAASAKSGTNGAAQTSSANGTSNGTSKGTSSGTSNGTPNGTSNGTSNGAGRVNDNRNGNASPTPTPLTPSRSSRLEDLFIFDPTAPGADAALDDDETSVVDGASLIMPSNLSTTDVPALLSGLETTVVEDATHDGPPDEATHSVADAAASLRETPGSQFAFEEAEAPAVDNVLNASLVDINNLGSIRVIEPTPGLVLAMEFIPPVVEPVRAVEAPAADAEAEMPEITEEAPVADNTEMPAVDAHATDVEQAHDEVAPSAIDLDAVGVDSVVLDSVDHDAVDRDAVVANEMPVPPHVEDHAVDLIVASTDDDAVHHGDDIVWLTDDSEPARAEADEPQSHALDEDAMLRESEIFWFEPEPVAAVDDVEPEDTPDVAHAASTDVRSDSPVGAQGNASSDSLTDAPVDTSGSASDDASRGTVIEFLDVDYSDDVALDDADASDAAANNVATSDIAANDADTPVAPEATLDVESGEFEAEWLADIEAAAATVPDAGDMANVPVDSAMDDTVSDLPLLGVDDASDIGTTDVAAPIEGLTVEDEDFAASLPFVVTPTIPTEALADGLIVDVPDPAVLTAAPPLDGFVSEDGTADDGRRVLAHHLTPSASSTSTEPPVLAEMSAPPRRGNQHDFILPGELPPLMLPNECVEAGLRTALPTANEAEFDAGAADPFQAIVAAQAALEAIDSSDDAVETSREADAIDDDSLDDLGDLFGSTDVPASVAAAEATLVAASRRDELQSAVKAAPKDWNLRRRLAHALFEVGERDAALMELQDALAGYERAGDLATASELADELVLVDAERVMFHQKRVELSIRLKDDNRLRVAYLDLADTLVRSGDEAPARAVYARVLEIDPWDDRARLALGDAAPPPPQAAQPDDDYVDLADWLRDDDEPVSTRMRMREPAVTGNEQEDFDSLLRHFKEGVARSLGEEDYESHYDLGVAYKEMGLLDDAVAEFQKALRSRTHRLAAYEALGQCFMEQGSYQVADTVLSRALHEPGLGDEQRVGVLYLLGYACEALQRFGEARSYFERVYATDIHFRDVATRLATLDQLAR